MSSHFRLLQICGNYQLASVVNNIYLAEVENASASAPSKEEADLQCNNPDIWMEYAAADLKIWMGDVAEASEITERGMEEAAKEAEVKEDTNKATTFL